MSKISNEKLRAKYVELLAQFLKDHGEEVLVTGSNELCIPTVDDENEDQYVCFTVKVPTGSRDGEAYDGYAMAQDFQMKQEAKTAKAKEAAAKKAAKIARDQKMREDKAAAKVAHQKAE